MPVAAAVGVAAGAWLVPTGDPPPPPVVRFAIAPADLDTSGQASPEISSDGRQLLFVARSGRPDRSSAYVGFLDGRPPARLMETITQVRYSASGHLLYVQDTTLMARALNASTLTLEGDPIPIADGIQAAGTGLRARFSLSETGVLVQQAMAEPRFQLRWYDRSGQSTGPFIGDAINNFRISPDASQVVLDLVDTTRGGRSVWLVDVPTGSRTRVTFGESDDWLPIWSRDWDADPVRVVS
ncbi:MAG: hypothetical protein AB7H81_19800 [Vicinamibacterales bacterium]